MKELKLEIPAGCDVDKIETQEGHIVVTFKEKERKLPKSWEEFCETFPMNSKEHYIEYDSEITPFDIETEISKRNNIRDRNLLPDRSTAEAVLALCQLIQLRNCFNGDWVPDWEDDDSIKYVIDFPKGCVLATEYVVASSPLYFKTKELRDKFLKYFRPLIEKLKPLYGIKEGGEE